MSDGVSIRRAEPGDADAIRAMVQALADDTLRRKIDVLTTDDIRRYGFGDDPAFSCLIAERSGAAVAMAIYFYEFSTWRGRRGVYVQDLYVTAAMQSRGLGQRLLAAAIAEGKKDGAVYLRLSVDRDNARAMKFYERLGFVAMTEDVAYMLEREAFEALGGSSERLDQ